MKIQLSPQPSLLMILLIISALSCSINAKSSQHDVAKKYDEISRLETSAERREYLNRQTDEMKAALWKENIRRKSAKLELTNEQKTALDQIKNELLTAEFFKSTKGKKEDAPEFARYREIMANAQKVFERETLLDLIFVMGDASTLKK